MNKLGISKEVLDYAADIEESLKERFEGIDHGLLNTTS